MRRLVLELSLNDVIRKLNQKNSLTQSIRLDDSKLPDDSNYLTLRQLEMLQKIKLFEILHMLRHDEEEFAAIFRIEPKDTALNIEELLKAFLFDVKYEYQLLEYEEGTYTYFVKGKHQQPSPETQSKKANMYPILPFSLRDEKIRVTWVGDNEQVKEFLESIGISYKIISLMDAKFSPSSPFSRLTEKQRDAIILAFKLGYYETPRKISVNELATKFGLANSTLAVHLRRAERRLLAEILAE
jgi:predicted DNA binding protein